MPPMSKRRRTLTCACAHSINAHHKGATTGCRVHGCGCLKFESIATFEANQAAAKLRKQGFVDA